jgi:hypothetical protein
LSRRLAAGVYIFIDESGTFTTSDKTDSWCVIAAYVCPEFRRAQIDRLIRDLRTQFGAGKEVKLRDMPVDRYIRLLVDLARLRWGISVGASTERTRATLRITKSSSRGSFP